MARKYYLNDEQRIVLFKELRPTLLAPPVEKDETIQEITLQCEQTTQQLEAWQQYETQQSRMQEVDAVLDTCFLGFDAALAAVQHKAFVTQDLTTWEQAQQIRKTLFPKGLSAIIHVPYQAEATESLAFLHRCEQAEISAFLQQHQLTEWLTFLRDTRTEYLQAIEENKHRQADRSKLSQQTQAARKSFDQLLARLSRYLRAKFPDNHPQAAWRQNTIEAILARTEAAVVAAQKARPQTSAPSSMASKTSTPENNTTSSPAPENPTPDTHKTQNPTPSPSHTPDKC